MSRKKQEVAVVSFPLSGVVEFEFVGSCIVREHIHPFVQFFRGFRFGNRGVNIF